MSLKEKSHIRVNDDAVLIGIPDGFSLLKPGEVFMRYQRETSLEFKQEILAQERAIENLKSEPKSKNPSDKVFEKIDVGERCETRQEKLRLPSVPKVIVTKNPCSHPGDIRLLTPVSIGSLKARLRELFPPNPPAGLNAEEALEFMRGVMSRQSEAIL